MAVAVIVLLTLLPDPSTRKHHEARHRCRMGALGKEGARCASRREGETVAEKTS